MTQRLFARLDQNSDRVVTWQEFDSTLMAVIAEDSAEAQIPTDGALALTKIERLRQVHQTRLSKARERLEGHLLRSLRMQTQRVRRIEDKREKFEQRMRDVELNREKKLRKRKEDAQQREKCAAEKMAANKQREVERQKLLLDRFSKVDHRQQQSHNDRAFKLEVRRERGKLAASEKMQGIERRAKADEWLKLCTVDRVRRKHERAVSNERAMRSLVMTSNTEREQMLRENNATKELLRNPPRSVSRMMLSASI